MYASKFFSEEYMIKYKMTPTNDKENWTNMLTYFITLYAMQKAYSEYQAAESGFESEANATHISLSMRIGNYPINLNTGGTMGTPEYEAETAYREYVKGLE